MVWENVPGAFSSNKGDDFRAVLEETVRVAEPDAPDIPLPENGKWPLADAWYGDGWSVAYRVLDAQFWGVPQRRRRIALVADFGGWAAPEILFIRESVCWDSAESRTPEETVTAGVGGGADCESLTNRGCFCGNVAETLRAESHGAIPMICAGFKPRAGANAGNVGYAEEKSPTIDTGKPMAVFDARGNGDGKTACTLTGDHQSRVTDYTAIVMEAGEEKTYQKVTGALCANSHHGGYTGQDTYSDMLVTSGTVRRLTPLECERLQGYPDGWTDIGPWTDSAGKLHKESSDSARYKALGNSIALPPWAWVLKRLCSRS